MSDIVWELVPGASLGPFSFGQSASEAEKTAREILGDPTANEPGRTRFLENAVLLEYEDEGLVFIEVAAGAGVDVSVGGALLAGATDAEIREALGEPDVDDEEYPATFAYPDLGLVLWRSTSPEDVERARSEGEEGDDEFWAAELESASLFETIAVAAPGYRD